MIIALILALGIIVLDQVTKSLLYGMSLSLIGDFLWIDSSFNGGAAYGMMQGGRVFFIIMTIPVIAAIIYIICSKKYLNNFTKICLGIILGGAVGNFIDRLFLGGVRDFIFFKSISFPNFNVADIAITVGTIMFVIGIIIYIAKNPDKKQKQDRVSNLQEKAQGKEENPEKMEALKSLRDSLKETQKTEKKDGEGKE